MQNEIVYFIQSGEEGPIKIGTTSEDIKKRVAGLQTGNPYKLKILKVISGGRELEQEIHERFFDIRMMGEWFYPSQLLLDYIENGSEIISKQQESLRRYLEQQKVWDVNPDIQQWEMVWNSDGTINKEETLDAKNN